MRLYELILETRSADLYHGTGFYGADLILKSNTLEAGEFNICSFSRSPGPAGMRGGGNSISKDERPRSGGVIFVIDRNLLSRDYGKKLRPISPDNGYWGRTEAEEGVVGNVRNFSKYIKEIWINITPLTFNSIVDEENDADKYHEMVRNGVPEIEILKHIYPAIFNNPRAKIKPYKAYFVESDEMLSELRRNPDLNVKAEGHEAAVNFLKNKDVRKYGVSMTELPKLGINPGSTFNTPVGIYFYPAAYYIRTKESGSELEWKDDAPYIQILELNGNFEAIDKMSNSVFTAYVKKLFDNADKIGSYINKSEKATTNLLGRLLVEARTEAKNNSYGGWLWYILYCLGYYASRDYRENMPPRSSVVWNSVLRLLGIDGVIDEGGGIIHENEPHAGVALNPLSIKHVATFTNKPGND